MCPFPVIAPKSTSAVFLKVKITSRLRGLDFRAEQFASVCVLVGTHLARSCRRSLNDVCEADPVLER